MFVSKATRQTRDSLDLLDLPWCVIAAASVNRVFGMAANLYADAAQPAVARGVGRVVAYDIPVIDV